MPASNHSGSSAHKSSRQAILDRLRSGAAEHPELPGVDDSRLTLFDDPIDVFVETLRSVGGEAHLVESAAQIGDRLAAIPTFAEAERVLSLVPDAIPGNTDASARDPHAHESLDWVIAKGDFMVAENGAIWIDGADLPHRVLLFIPQYLAIVVSRGNIVHNMHQAYARIGQPTAPFGVFVAGPSKTADIEQSLVLGAHGCRALQVFVTP